MKGANLAVELLAMLTDLPTFQLNEVSVTSQGTFIYFDLFELRYEMFIYRTQTTIWIESPLTGDTVHKLQRKSRSVQEVKTELLAVA